MFASYIAKFPLRTMIYKTGIVFAGFVSAAIITTNVQAEALPRVQIKTNMGTFTVELYPAKTPKTVANFLQYVNDKHYDGTVFHRVIDNFMVQGGGFDSTYTEKKTRPPVAHEGQEAIAKGGLKNVVGTLAMARTNDPQSATAQFFINVKDNAFLDPTPIPPGDPVPVFEYQNKTYKNVPRNQLVSSPQLFGYTVFGKVVEGMENVDKIAKVKTKTVGFHENVPTDMVLITGASRFE